jgi:hypothetical protein
MHKLVIDLRPSHSPQSKCARLLLAKAIQRAQELQKERFTNSALWRRSKNFGVVLWINLLQCGKELGTPIFEVANDPVEIGEESFKACGIS